MNVLIIGANGMIGRTIYQVLKSDVSLNVFGSVRNPSALECVQQDLRGSISPGITCENLDSLHTLLKKIQPDYVINCAGITKHLPNVNNAIDVITANALFPHQLSNLCEQFKARLIHISTDCVFSGEKGSYTEEDNADADDLYGRSKILGEVTSPPALTIRTSTIGHEYLTKNGLLEWFLSQEKQCYGFKNAIFSGLPTVVLGEVIKEKILPRRDLTGLYHIAAEPISKFDLLNLIAKTYEKEIEIIPEHEFVIDRSLNAEKFNSMTGFKAPSWSELINKMHSFK